MQKETRRNSAAGSAKPNPPRKLTRAEKKQIAEIIRQAKGDGKAHTAQQTIPYIQMYPDGICKVTGRKYSKTVAFEDINYQLAQADDKTAIFENWCDFLNYFDASVSVQLSFINQGTQRGEAEKAVNIPAQEDAFNSIRTEYRDMLKNQLAKGNNGLVKAKYITFAIEADSLGAAKSRLARIETDVLNNFKLLGVSARPMTGYERLKMLHGIFHPEGGQFAFDFSWLAPSGLSTKDFIAPSSFRFGEGRYFRMGRKIGAVSFLEILAPELNDRILSDMSREQIEAAGYGFHHQSDDGKYLIMGNGTRAFAVAAEQPEKANPLKHIEDTVEQNDNNFDGIINNTPTVDELEAKVKAGETISLVDLANAVKADKERGKEAKPEKKPSIRAQLRADKEKAQKKNAKQKLQDLERS